ncbi:hypothetical protein BV20DRAFT_1054677 [Pilatotrama ljubarskyi]|nr:hypothetical protein BV20DRAFT_1054677 [Pilatotrama ljubarskyi]
MAPTSSSIFTMLATSASVYATDVADDASDTTKWEYCSVLLVLLEGGMGFFIIDDNMTCASDEETLMVTWTVPDVREHVSIKFCLKEEFWIFMGDISVGKAGFVQGQKDRQGASQQLEDVRRQFDAYFNEGASSSFNIYRVRAGFPRSTDMRSDMGCWCKIESPEY